VNLLEHEQLRLVVAAAMAHGILSNPKGLDIKPDELVVAAYAVADELLSTMEAAITDAAKP
jgi:hypothetical protein